MRLTAEMIRSNVKYEFDYSDAYQIGSDQMYVTYPIRFPTITVPLTATDVLIDCAFDGMKNQYPDIVLDCLWINFYATFRLMSDGVHSDNCIECCVSTDTDTFDTTIDLDDDAQDALIETISKQMKPLAGVSIAEALLESKQELEKEVA